VLSSEINEKVNCGGLKDADAEASKSGLVVDTDRW